MSAVQSIFSSRRAEKWLPWLGALVLAAGTAAVLIKFGTADDTSTAGSRGNVVLPEQPKRAPVDPEAQNVAGQFIQTAVGRRNLDRAWKITHPELKAGMTLREWRTGQIPVIPVEIQKYDPKLIAYRVRWSFENEVLLEVLLVPKDGVKNVTPQTFYIGLKADEKGADKHWLVNYWMTSYKPPVRPDPVAKG